MVTNEEIKRIARMIRYLNANPRNALVLLSAEDKTLGTRVFEPNI